jgi:CMP-2-keto-3-deoxyoctulosonic acid synthetase
MAFAEFKMRDIGVIGLDREALESYLPVYVEQLEAAETLHF